MNYGADSGSGYAGISEKLNIASLVGFQEGRSFSSSGIAGWRTAQGTGDTTIIDSAHGALTPDGYSISSTLQSAGDLNLQSSTSANANNYGGSQSTAILGAGSIASFATTGSNIASQSYESKDGSLISQQSFGAAGGQVALSGSTSIDGPGQISTDARNDIYGSSYNAVTDGNGNEHLSGDTLAASGVPKVTFSSLKASGDFVSFSSQENDLEGTYTSQNTQSEVTSPIESSQVSYVTDSGISKSWDVSSSGTISPISQTWASNDGKKKVTNEVSGSGNSYSIKGSAATGDNSVSISQHLSISKENGKLNTKQTAEGQTNGETLTASNALDSTGSVEGDQWAGADASKVYASQKIKLTGAATDSTSSAAGNDKSSAKASIENGEGIDLNVASTAWNNLVSSTTYHRTSANLAVTGKASTADASSASIYGLKTADAHGKWTSGKGDISVKSETVKSATASVELTTDSDNAFTETSSGTMLADGTRSSTDSGIKVSAKETKVKGDVHKFESHLYSHSYPKNDNHEIDESVSTGSAGWDGTDIVADLSLWNGKSWYQKDKYTIGTDRYKVIRVNDIFTSNSNIQKVWELPARVVTPTTTTPWGVGMLYNGQYTKSSTAGRWIDVGVIDSGIDARHPDLVMRLEDYSTSNGPGEADESDSDGHGTHVSGIIAADGGFDGKGVWGMAPGANLIVYANTNVYGIYRATDLGAEIVSMSFGTYGLSEEDKEFRRKAVSYALNYGVLPVAAAGNGAPDDPAIIYPAAIAGVVAVGAVDSNGNAIEWTTPGYNDGNGVIDGNKVMFGAPGVSVYSTTPTYKTKDYARGYGNASGTSMATPHISGLAAKLWSDRIYYGGTATDVTGLMQGYAKNNRVTKVQISNNADDAVYKKALEVVGSTTAPGKYYTQLLSKWEAGKVVELDILKGDSPLTGLGIPKIPK
ncbi:MAG TPA: S8 family serine peptidase [Methanotrichaceae archaeon]|nr:S8 family serine peptidase [Methanotrichaceae archaeon]